MNYVVIVLVAFVVTAIAGCSHTPQRIAEVRVEVLPQPQQKWLLANVAVKEHSRHIHVRGRVIPRSWTQRPRGHIDIAAYSLSGDVIFESATRYQKTLSFFHGRFRMGIVNRFNAEITEKFEEVAEIKVAFHQSEEQLGDMSGHINIAIR